MADDSTMGRRSHDDGSQTTNEAHARGKNIDAVGVPLVFLRSLQTALLFLFPTYLSLAVTANRAVPLPMPISAQSSGAESV